MPDFSWYDPYGMFTNIARGAQGQLPQEKRGWMDELAQTPGAELAAMFAAPGGRMSDPRQAKVLSRMIEEANLSSPRLAETTKDVGVRFPLSRPSGVPSTVAESYQLGSRRPEVYTPNLPTIIHGGLHPGYETDPAFRQLGQEFFSKESGKLIPFLERLGYPGKYMAEESAVRLGESTLAKGGILDRFFNPVLPNFLDPKWSKRLNELFKTPPQSTLDNILRSEREPIGSFKLAEIRQEQVAAQRVPRIGKGGGMTSARKPFTTEPTPQTGAWIKRYNPKTGNEEWVNLVDEAKWKGLIK